MATPTVSASLDKPSYKVGDLVTLTVNYADADTKTLSVTVTVTDAENNTSLPTTVTAVIDPLTVNVSDASNHVWAKKSDTGSVAVYTTTA